MSKQFISGSWRRVLWTRTEPQEWGQTTCQNDQRENEIKLVFSSLLLKERLFIFSSSFFFHVCVLFAFVFCGDLGHAAKRTLGWWKLLETSCQALVHLSQREYRGATDGRDYTIKHITNPQGLVSHWTLLCFFITLIPAFLSLASWITASCVHLCMFTHSLKLQATLFISCDWVTSVLALKKCSNRDTHWILFELGEYWVLMVHKRMTHCSYCHCMFFGTVEKKHFLFISKLKNTKQLLVLHRSS